MYKITFKMVSPVVLMDNVTFDSILAYCVYSHYRKITDIKTSGGKEIDESKQDIPVTKHKDGFYLASWDITTEEHESVERWRKRWDNTNDRLADFKKAKRKIDTARGKYKSYDMPIVVKSIDEISFYFKSKEVGKVSFFINNYLVGIGKKVKMGYGWFSGFEIEKVKDSDVLYYRPTPKNFKSPLKTIDGFGGIKPPYWHNQQDIKIPSLHF